MERKLFDGVSSEKCQLIERWMREELSCICYRTCISRLVQSNKHKYNVLSYTILTSSISINISNCRINHSGVQESLIANPQSTLRLVLWPLIWSPRCFHSFECSSWNCIIYNASWGNRVSLQQWKSPFNIFTHGISYRFPVLLSTTVNDSFRFWAPISKILGK